VQDADIVWVSRPHNMERLLLWLVTGEIRAGCRLVYDAEAIFACRDKIKAAVLGWEASGAVMDAWLSRELDLARAADAVVCVSPRDSATIAGCGLPNVHIVGHQLGLSPTPTDFQGRKRFLFVGAMHGRDNPNADSMRYFCNEVWPIVQASTGTELLIAGYGTDGIGEELVGRGIHVVGPQDDLFPLYNEARVFVVPTRYAAGIPFKAHEAAAHGVPLVVSQLVGEQLGWHNESECLIAVGPTQFADACCRLYKDEELWSRIRAAALRRVEQDLSEAQFGDSIDQLIETVKCRKG
jgi:glycosyltransferase involved in cell wall biosynthesis